MMNNKRYGFVSDGKAMIIDIDGRIYELSQFVKTK